MYLEDQSSVRCGVGENLFQFFRLLFCFIDSVLCLTEDFKFLEVPFISCRSQGLCYLCNIQEVDSCDSAFKATFPFLFCQVQYNWFRVEVFGSLGHGFYAG